MEYIYVLKCANNKYYVGKTNNLQKRLVLHNSGYGSEWTKLHKPEKIILSEPLKDKYHEDNLTEEYMAEFGIDNVRGGSYCQLDFSSEIYGHLVKKIRHTDDKCFNCGGNHLAKDCNYDKPNAYKYWSNNEENKLEEMVENGLDINKIANKLGRSEGAICARLEQLGYESESSNENCNNYYGNNYHLDDDDYEDY